MKKNESQQCTTVDQSPQFLSLEDNVFKKLKDGRIFIGKREATKELLSSLKTDAERFVTTRLFQILSDTITNEAYDIALKQSKNFEEVLNAKMLSHWNFVLTNMVLELAKPQK